MKTVRFIIIIVLGMMLSSCLGYYKKVSHLSDEELEWVNCYNVGDTVLFQSDIDMVDTLVVTSKYIENSLKPSVPFIYRLFYAVDDYYLASAVYYFNIKGSENSYEGYFDIIKRADNDSIMFRSGLNERTSEQMAMELIDDTEVYYSVIQIDVQDIVYNGAVLSDCIVYDDTNSETHKMSVKAPDNTDYYIDSYIISKKYGLISYKLKNGETFTRVADEAQL